MTTSIDTFRALVPATMQAYHEVSAGHDWDWDDDISYAAVPRGTEHVFVTLRHTAQGIDISVLGADIDYHRDLHTLRDIHHSLQDLRDLGLSM